MKTQRIWNKSELEQIDEWKEDESGDFLHTEKKCWITKWVLGKSIDTLIEMDYPVFDEMIAKPEPTDEEERELLLEAVEEAGVKLKERLDKGEIGITLENGTTITVGSKYFRDAWFKDMYVTVLCIHKDKLFCELSDGTVVGSYNLKEDWLPYEPKEEPKPLEGYQKWYIHLDRNVVKVEYMTKEQAVSLVYKSHILGVYTEQQAIDLGLNI